MIKRTTLREKERDREKERRERERSKGAISIDEYQHRV